MTELFAKDHLILEKEFMECQPFGIDAEGQRISDVSGATVAANVYYLEEVVGRSQGDEAGGRAAESLCRLLNGRIRNSAYHVTPDFLKNTWNSYSYEFVCFLGEFCKILSGDPQFEFNVGKEKFISPIIMTLGRPFAISQIYRMFAAFGDKFAKGSILFGVGNVTSGSAVLRMKFTDRVYKQFGPYRKACAHLICQSSKGALADIPERFQRLPPAAIVDRSCIANGDEYCEWEITWKQPPSRRLRPLLAGLLTGGALFGALRLWEPSLSILSSLALSLIPMTALGLAYTSWTFYREGKEKEALLQEQIRFGDARYEELRGSYLERQQMAIDLRQRLGQLTTLYQIGSILNSTLDREVLVMRALQGIIDNLHYDRAMVSSYDDVRKISYDARILGVPEEVAAYARSIEVPVADPDSIEGTVLLRGMPVLLEDIQKEWDRLHPLTRQLVSMTKANALISVPLKVKGRVIGGLTVDRVGEHRLLQEDLDLMVTVASQIAIAFDNADAYSKIEELNIGLEAKVRDRTVALEKLNNDLGTANEKLRDMDRLKSLFVSIVSHELRTPMTSIKGYVDNAIDGIAGDLSGKQIYYMTRIKHNVDRLLRMTRDLLDLSRIEAGQFELHPETFSVPQLINDVVEGFNVIAAERSIAIQAHHAEGQPMVRGDRDKLHQVLSNLIDNAIKFTPAGGEVRVASDLEGGFIRVRVADTGSGIPPHEIDKVFDKFYRGETVRSDSRGAGLGLALARDLVRLHGGRIWVASEVGKRSEFSFTLPVRRDADPAVPGDA